MFLLGTVWKRLSSLWNVYLCFPFIMTHSSMLFCLDSRTLTWWTIPGTHLRPGTRPSSCALFSSNVFTEDINKSTSHLSKKKKSFFSNVGVEFCNMLWRAQCFFFLTTYPNLLHLIRLPCNFISLILGPWRPSSSTEIMCKPVFFTSLISNSLALLFCLVCLFLVCPYKPWLPS